MQLKIVAELYSRAMSPTLFYNEFGGSSASRVAKLFTKLEDGEWLRHMYDAIGPSGRMEGFYRATEPALVDTESWALVPYSLRVSWSWAVFNQMVPVLRTAMEERRSDQYRDLSCTPLLLDETGWTNVIGAMDAQLTSLFEHQDDSRFRVAHTGEELIRVDVFMFGFEMPLPGSERVGPDLVMRAEPLGSIHERLSPAIADDMCRRIVKELNLRPMSAARSITPLGTSSTAPPIETSEGLRREPARDERRDGGVRVAQGRAKSALIMCVGAAQALSRSR